MGTQNFEKQKVQVRYAITFALTEDAKTLKPHKADADKLIAAITKEDAWGFDGALKTATTMDRIKSITYPQIRNGHTGEDGHTWQWQLDTESMGAGSKMRLYLDDVKATIASQKVDAKTVKVGKDQFTVINCQVKLTGTFTAGQKH